MRRIGLNGTAIWTMAALLCLAGCNSAPRQSSGFRFDPTGGVPPKVEEARLIQAVENNPHIPRKMKPGIIKSIKSHYRPMPGPKAAHPFK